MSQRPQRLVFPQPMPESAAGIPLVSPAFGVVLWGERSSVRLSLALSSSFAPFGEEAPLPIGRIDLQLPDDWSIFQAALNPESGEAELELGTRHPTGKLRATVLLESPVLCVRLAGIDAAQVKVVPRPPDAPEILERIRSAGVGRAQLFDLVEFAGWTRDEGGERSLCVGWSTAPSAGGMVLYVTACHGTSPADARRAALSVLEETRSLGYTPATLRSYSARRHWWERLPEGYRDPLLQPVFYSRMGVSGCQDRDDLSILDGATHWEVTPDRRLILHSGRCPVFDWPVTHLTPQWMLGEAVGGHRRELPPGLPRGYHPTR